jgi:hypothetical protein
VFRRSWLPRCPVPCSSCLRRRWQEGERAPAERSLECRSQTLRRWSSSTTSIPIAVQADPSATDEQLAAISDAIATWSSTLEGCLRRADHADDCDGQQAQGGGRRRPLRVHRGRRRLRGLRICGDHGCPNTLVRSDLPPSLDRESYDPEYLGWVTLYEIGHALGLRHATNLLESTDLMGVWTAGFR